MFENTRWSNPNYQTNFDYAQRVEAARQGMPFANFASQGLNTIGKAIEGYAQRKRVDDILKQMYTGGGTSATEAGNPTLAGGGGSVTEAGNPMMAGYVPPISEKEVEDLRKKYLMHNFFNQPIEGYYFDYGV